MLLNDHIQLDGDARARVRLPHAADRSAVDALHERIGLDGSELDARRALRFDPRTEVVLCATAWIGTTELLVGYGSIRRDAVAPHALVCDDVNAPGLRSALHEALTQAATHRRAA